MKKRDIERKRGKKRVGLKYSDGYVLMDGYIRKGEMEKERNKEQGKDWDLEG